MCAANTTDLTPDPLGFIIGMASIAVIVLLFLYCDDLEKIR